MNGSERVAPEELAALPFFDGVDPTVLEPLAGLALRRVLTDGETLVSQGDPATSIWFVVHGQLALRIVVDGTSLLVMTLLSGEILGWSALRGGATALSTARAVGSTELIEVPSEALLDLLAGGTPASRLLIRRLAAAAATHLETTRRQLLRHGHDAVISGG